jgi:excisionase family DNA binding protein
MTTTAPQPDPPRWSPEATQALGPSSPEPLLWSPAQTAVRLSMSRAGVYELLASGQLASLKVGRRRLIPDEELRKFIAAKLAESAEW